MPASRLESRRRFFDLSLAVAFVGALGHWGVDVYSRAVSPPERLDRAALGPKTGERALVLVTSSNCHFCRESLPFYRELVPNAQRHGWRVIAVTPEEPETNQMYLNSNGVSPDVFLQGEAAHIRANRTPTVILLGLDSTLKYWVGKLSMKQERELMKNVD
jgi:hypothetical protein